MLVMDEPLKGSHAVLQSMRKRRNETRVAQLASYPYHAIYHQYTRSLLRENLRWLPLWFSIGFSEFFANTRFQDGKFYVGAPSARVNNARNRSLLAMTEFIAVKPDYIPRTEVFYVQSWALIHMLMMKPNDEGKSLQRFVSRLEAGKAQKGRVPGGDR